MSGHVAYDRGGAEALVDGMVASGARVSLGFVMGLKKISRARSFRFMGLNQRGAQVELIEVVVHRPSAAESGLLESMGFAVHGQKRAVMYRGQMAPGDASWVLGG